MGSPSASELRPEAWLLEPLTGVRLLPVIHDRLDMAALVREVLAELDPAAVAVELPPPIAEAARRAARRLPRISLVISEPGDAEALVWVSAPGDPFAEALRWAEDRERPSFFVDPDLPYEAKHHDAVPDPYALHHLGPAEYMRLLRDAARGAVKDPADARREAGMAHFLKQVREKQPEGLVLVLLGAAHVEPVAELLQKPTVEPFSRVRRSHLEIRHLHPDSMTAILPDPPLAQACYELLRSGAELSDVSLESTFSQRVSLRRHGLSLITGLKDETDTKRPFHRARFAARRSQREGFGRFPVVDRRRLQDVAWSMATRSYEAQTQESVKPWQRRLFFDYSRRHARLQSLLVPGLYEWVMAARGVGDDNLAWEIFDVARTYPWQQEAAEIATVRVDGDELDLGTRKVRFRKRSFRVKKRFVPVKERPGTSDPSKWLEAFDSSGICSHRPEDIVIEDYARFLQRKAVSILSAEQARSEPFSTSMLDGIDMRETLRNLHENKIYVREMGRAPGEAGSVVVIFDRDLTGLDFPYCMTWLGENEQESDMAFYATEPSEQIVGPGIMRASYGGLMMTYPPRRLYDVWQDPDYLKAREKSEVLLMSAVDYSEEKLVVHLAADAPGEAMTRYAAQRGKRIVHIPIGSMSPLSLKKIRALHLLAGQDKRAVAKDYIW